MFWEICRRRNDVRLLTVCRRRFVVGKITLYHGRYYDHLVPAGICHDTAKRADTRVGFPVIFS